MSFGLLISIIILAGIGTLAFLILGIIALAGGNRKNSITFSVLFLASVITLIFTITEMIGRVARKVKSGVENISETIEDEKRKEHSERDAYLQWLKECSGDTADADFFNTYDARKEVYCIPLVYPYRLEMSSSFSDEADLAYAAEKPLPVNISEMKSITEAAFDKNYLLAKREFQSPEKAAASDLPEVSYIIFEFRTGKINTYYNRQRMISEAEKLGYSGRTELQEIYDIYRKLAD